MLMLDLLRHTSGLTYDFQYHSNVDAAYRERKLDMLRPGFTLGQLVETLGTLPLEFSPGEAWNYSVSTDVVGLVVERISGLPFAEFLQTRIFGPLGMRDTGFHVPPEKRDCLTDAWFLHPKKGRILYDAAEESSWAKPPMLAGGGGGLASTTADYHRFCRMLLGGGALDGVRLLGRKTLDLMTRNHLPGGGALPTLSRSMISEAKSAG